MSLISPMQKKKMTFTVKSDIFVASQITGRQSSSDVEDTALDYRSSLLAGSGSKRLVVM